MARKPSAGDWSDIIDDLLVTATELFNILAYNIPSESILSEGLTGSFHIVR